MGKKDSSFWADGEEGIFANHETAAAGDEDAQHDLEQEDELPPLQFVTGPDGLPMPAGFQEAPNDHADVSPRSLLCLAGCKHYVEAVCDLEPGSEERVTIRRCRRLRTWAELMDLSEADVWACSGFEPSAPPTDAAVYSAVQRNAELLDGLHENRPDELRSVCEAGPCEHYMELIVQGPNDVDQRTMRYCTALAGAARQFDLTVRLVRGCSSWRPMSSSEEVSVAGVASARVLMEQRKRHEEATDGD